MDLHMYILKLKALASYHYYLLLLSRDDSRKW